MMLRSSWVPIKPASAFAMVAPQCGSECVSTQTLYWSECTLVYPFTRNNISAHSVVTCNFVSVAGEGIDEQAELIKTHINTRVNKITTEPITVSTTQRTCGIVGIPPKSSRERGGQILPHCSEGARLGKRH